MEVRRFGDRWERPVEDEIDENEKAFVAATGAVIRLGAWVHGCMGAWVHGCRAVQARELAVPGCQTRCVELMDGSVNAWIIERKALG
ncbi:hypothetical protein [Reinekea sp. G2M2-21]|uniref:hypothetical protein n=1 Tax=Reinekea sp. G2M2-21 TaxID=2788942 RepID=UPI0018A9043A|nr:hypothetical protein [Reinekea sp. G2M2-21]